MAQATVAFDLLEAVRELRAAGIATDRAEAIARNIGKAAKDNERIARIEEGIEHNASKEDVSNSKSDIFRALWWQGLFVIVATAALIGSAVIVIVDRLPGG